MWRLIGVRSGQPGPRTRRPRVLAPIRPSGSARYGSVRSATRLRAPGPAARRGSHAHDPPVLGPAAPRDLPEAATSRGPGRSPTEAGTMGADLRSGSPGTAERAHAASAPALRFRSLRGRVQFPTGGPARRRVTGRAHERIGSEPGRRSRGGGCVARREPTVRVRMREGTPWAPLAFATQSVPCPGPC
jgi:hypothetical protein